MVLLITCDNQQFSVDREVLKHSATIENTLEARDGAEDQPIPLTQILEYCEHHRGDPLPVAGADENQERATDLSEWDKKFLEVEQEMLFEIILAANHLDIKPLLDAGCRTVADMIKGKTPEEIRKLFNIVGEFTPEEEAQIRRENEWSEDC